MPEKDAIETYAKILASDPAGSFWTAQASTEAEKSMRESWDRIP